MSYQVVVTFDLIDASEQDQERTKEELAKIALYDSVEGKNGPVRLPPNTVQGEWAGGSAERVADAVKQEIARAFARCSVTGPIFVSVGGEDWTWAIRGG